MNVRSLDEDVEVEAVGGASVKEVASDVDVGKLIGVESTEGDVNATGSAFFPIDLMMCTDLVGRISASWRVTGGKSASRTDWKEM